MRRLIGTMMILAAAWVCGAAAAADAPYALGGFVLDRPIEEFAELVLMETSLPVRYMENIYEVEIKPVEGFKSGLIAYATCGQPRRIVRIKLKYDDGGLDYFEDLLKRYKKRFGEPGQYLGDPFKNLIVWKWSFSDPKGENRVSLTLQHNALDEDEKMGNAVKLTLVNRVEEDLRCAQESQAGMREKLRQRRLEMRRAPADRWDLLVPR
jgi:hypothetical protein